jgi:hypothetical protein
MRFAKQKLLIVLCFLLMPHALLLALLETQELSTWVLNMSLRFARLRTGLKIDAAGWEVSPLAFSAKLKNVEIHHENITLVVPRLEVWVSPVALLVGRLHLSNLELADAHVAVADKELFSKNIFMGESEKSGDFEFLENLPSRLGLMALELIQRVKARNIAFTELRLTNLEAVVGQLHIKNIFLSLNNLQEGQLRLEWDLQQIKIQSGLAQVASFGGALSLLQSRSDQYQMYLANSYIALKDKKHPEFRLGGAWPGELNLNLDLKLEEVNAWIKASPWVQEHAFDTPSSGVLNVDANLKATHSTLSSAKVQLKTDNLIYEGAHLNRISTNLDFAFENEFSYKINSFEVILPQTLGVKKEWKNSLRMDSFKLEEKNLEMRLVLDEASLCGILLAVDEKECQVGVAFSGNLDIAGSLEPLELSVTPQLKFTRGPVMSDPYIMPQSEAILHLRSGELIGNFLAKEKDIDVLDLKLRWNEKDEMTAKGNIIYVPTQVRLSANANEASLDKIFEDIIDFSFGGKTTIEGQIVYDHRLSRAQRTFVATTLRSSAFNFEGQDLGSMTGPLRYENRVLQFGPFQMRSGGGSALVQGSLIPNDARGSYLSLSAQMNRYEFTAFLDEEKSSEAFRGFLTGRANLSGFVDGSRHPENGISGDLNVSARNFRAFKIPFNEAKFLGRYENRDLKVASLEAKKDGALVKLTGLLSPKGGSELLFESEPLPLRNIDIEPKLKLFEKGLVAIKGYWRPDSGWGVDGVVSEAQMAGAVLGAGRAELRGTENDFVLKMNLGNVFDLHYRGIYQGPLMLIDELEGKLKDKGIYAGLAYLGDWTQPMPVEAKGELNFKWRPQEGYFETKQLKIKGPHSQERTQDLLLDVPETQSLVWSEQGVIQNTVSWNGPAQLKVEAKERDKNLQIEGNLPLGLVRLFVPALDMRAGTAGLKAFVPLSPHFETLRAEGDIRNGILKIPGISTPFDDLNLNFTMQRSQLNIQRASARAGSGQIRVLGAYKVDFEQPAADIAIELERAQLVILDDVPGIINGSLQLRGEKPPYMLSGRLQATEGLYAKEFESAPEDLVELAEEVTLNFDIDVDVGANSQIKNSVVASQVRGQVKVLGDNILAILRGDLDLSGGTLYANNVEFSIVQSRIQFIGDKENIPLVNLRANTLIKYNNTDYKIEMTARGPGTSLAIDFTSDPPLVNRDIVSLLAFGVIRQDDAGEADDDLLSAAQAEAFQAVFGRAIGDSLSRTTGFDVRLRPATSATGRAENVPKVSVMRRLSDRVTARFARSLDINNPEKDLQVDYRLLNNVNLSGIWESPTPEESSLGVDLRFRFEVE